MVFFSYIAGFPSTFGWHDYIYIQVKLHVHGNTEVVENYLYLLESE